jgi:hypothetical protein
MHAVEKHKSRKTNKGTAQKVETYDSLVEKQKMTQKRIADVEAQLKSLQGNLINWDILIE